ncbi:MAG: VCBS repeat-containing protein [Deltaproteobacteria bacterium]|nr:VCBS repeat-containing protein [Candidatus Anaeroferrophillus wilburensis]MBN2888827.1 VCBS repeat-containing protein [Deltaproteobacteria bacterium]
MTSSFRSATWRHCKMLFFSLVILLSLSPNLAAAGSWQQLVNAAGANLAGGNLQAGRVMLLQDDAVIMEIADRRLSVGSLVAVKDTSLPGVPLPLQNNAALIRLTQLHGSQARGIIIDGTTGAIPPGAPLFPFSYNRLYLYTNLAAPERQFPYRDLTMELQQAHIPYAVKSFQELSYGPEMGIRPLILRLEGRDQQIIGQLTDLEGTVLMTIAYALPMPMPVTVPFGLRFQQGSGHSATQGAAHSFTRPGKAAANTQLASKIELKSGYNRLLFADLDGNGRDELVLLNNAWVEAFQIEGDQLKPFARYRLPHKDTLPLNLHCGDFNHNGKDELYVTLGLPVTVSDKPDTRLSSLVLEMENQNLRSLGSDFPYYFRVMETREGKQVLLAQEIDDFKQYKLPIRWAGFFAGKLEIKGEYQPAHNVFAVDNFILNPFNEDQLLVLDMEGGLGGYNAKNEDLLTTADESFGLYDEVIYLQKLAETEYEGGFSIKKTAVNRFAPRRFVLKSSFGRQAFLIKKERRINPELLEKGVSLLKDKASEHDQVVGVQWKDSGGIVETWKSPALARDIIDFTFTRVKSKDTMVLLTRNESGKYALEMVE